MYRPKEQNYKFGLFCRSEQCEIVLIMDLKFLHLSYTIADPQSENICSTATVLHLD